MKKNHSQLIFCVLIVLGFAMAVAGQEVAITKADFEKIETVGNNGLDGKTYRSTTVVETLVDGVSVPEKGQREISENIPPDRTREITMITRNGKSEKVETLKIGPRSWIRINGGTWRKNDETLGLGSAASERVLFESYKSKRRLKFGGVWVTEYEKVVKRKWGTYDNSFREETEILTTRIWVDKVGLMRKLEYERENIDTNEIYRESAVYEYNVKIKIEAPIK